MADERNRRTPRGGSARGGAQGREQRDRDRRGRGDERDARGRKGTSAGSARTPTRGRWVEHPPKRYVKAEAGEEEARPPKRPVLRTVVKGGPAAAAEPKRTTHARRAGPKQAPPPARRRRGPKRSAATDELARLAGRNATKALAALQEAADAFAAGRERDAARLLRPLADAYPDAAAVRELLGLAQYRLGNFGAARKELEAFVEISGSVEQHPVLMDCCRAQRRWTKVDALWRELADISPSAALVAEGRIVAAGALADQGKLTQAIALLEKKVGDVRQAREHHLRLWYALADLYERAGDVPQARTLFLRVRKQDASFADVAERLAALGSR